MRGQEEVSASAAATNAHTFFVQIEYRCKIQIPVVVKVADAIGMHIPTRGHCKRRIEEPVAGAERNLRIPLRRARRQQVENRVAIEVTRLEGCEKTADTRGCVWRAIDVTAHVLRNAHFKSIICDDIQIAVIVYIDRVNTTVVTQPE